ADLAQEVEGVEIRAVLGKSEAELFEIGSAAVATAETAATASAALKWRDKWVTWVMGQDLVDVPYDQEAAFDLLVERDGEDIDEKPRAVSVELSTTYDRETEGANIERVSQKLEDEGRMIVCGRISRAFGNQTQLLSAATHVDTTDMKGPVRSLVEAA